MKLEDIETLWAEDSKINRVNLDEESLLIPELHHKYYKIYMRERFQLKSEEAEYKQFYKLKYEYYHGKLSKEELEELGWEQFEFVLKGDLPVYMDADPEITSRLLKLDIQREKVKFLESIIDSLNKRTFVIKNAIEFIKFSSGA